MPAFRVLFAAALLWLSVAAPAWAQSPGGRQVIKTDGAPVPTAPYSQAIKANGFVFVAGQVGLDPKTRQLVTGGFEQETTQVMKNIQAILAAAGLGFADVVNTTIYLRDVGNFAKVNEIYGRYFTGDYPARTTVGVAALPGNANVEIAVVAVAR